MMETLNLDYIIRGLDPYFLPVNYLSKQKRAMRRGMNKPHSIIIKHYGELLIDLNEYLASFPGATFTDKISVTELNEILLIGMHNNWSKKAYVKVFYCESITFKRAVNVFDHMVITESIYEGKVLPSYLKTTQANANCAGHSRHNRG